MNSYDQNRKDLRDDVDVTSVPYSKFVGHLPILKLL